MLDLPCHAGFSGRAERPLWLRRFLSGLGERPLWLHRFLSGRGRGSGLTGCAGVSLVWGSGLSGCAGVSLVGGGSGLSGCAARAEGAHASVAAPHGLRCFGSWALEPKLNSVAHGLRCPMACGIFLDQGSNLCLLHWQADSLPLSLLGSPRP